jgi:hypothetical protein
MKSKTRVRRLISLGITFGLLMGGIASSKAVVGYVNVELEPGLNRLYLLVNPLDAGDDNANTVMPSMPDGSLLFRFDPVTQTYMDAATYFDGVGWYPRSGDSNDPALLLPPGEGFVVHVPQRCTNTFVGNVRQGWLTHPIPAKFSIRGSLVPIGGSLQTNLVFPSQPGDGIWRRTEINFTAYSYVAKLFKWQPSEPQINVAESFFVWRDPFLATPDHWWIVNFIVQFAAASTAVSGATALAARASPGPEIRSLAVETSMVTLQISNPGGVPYNLQFSSDGKVWRTVATNQIGSVWRTPRPAGVEGYYQLVNP